MIRRGLFPVLWCAAALAQLPAPQAPPPLFDGPAKSKTRKIPPTTKTPWRVDASATGPDGRPVPGLTAADFEVLTAGKPLKATAAEFESSAPLRIALMVDDLSLSAENLAGLRKTLHEFVSAQMRPGDEAAILCTSESNGIADEFTSDRPALDAAIDRLSSNRPASESPMAFSVGSIGALRSALLGLQFTPGRKLAVFLSERLRAADRTPDPTWVSRLVVSANRSSVVLYAVDVASSADPSYMLEQGLAGVAPQTGGAFFDAANDPGAALARIVASQQGYYILRFETEPLQRITPLAAKTQRPGVRVRARNGVLGLAGDGDGRGFVAPENELRAAIGSALFATGLHLDLTPKRDTSAEPSLEAVLHVKANEVTLTLRPDGKYHGQLEAMAALFQDNDAAVSQASRTATLLLTPEERQKAIASGFAFPVPLPAPKQGPYQLRAAVLDDTGGRLGAASHFFEARVLTLPLLTMAPIELEPAGDPPRPVYPPNQVVRYSYELANLRNDGANHAKVEVTNRLLRDGRVIYTGEPKILDVGLAQEQSSARISGTVKLGAEVQAGKFTLTVTALDTLATGAERRSATRSIDFEIQP
jgi:VWFA-related protein